MKTFSRRRIAAYAAIALAIVLASAASAAPNHRPRGFADVENAPTLVTGGLQSATTSVPSEAGIARRASEPLFIETERGASSSGSAIFSRTVNGVVKVLTNEGEGTGVVLSDKGLVLTNWHVIDGYREVGVRPYPSGKTEPSRTLIGDVVRYDEVADLALIQLRTPPSNLVVIRKASSLPRVGAEVHAIGHPKGQDWSYTRGYVSQIREQFSWKYEDGTAHKAEVVQTQTPINPGNSGGPLFNDSGQLIGINSFTDPDAQGINYAVSVNEVRAFLTRTESRTTQREGTPAGRGPRVLTVLDTNKNGIPDAQVADFDGNGVRDGLLFDDNEDGQVDVIFIDENENSIFDLWITAVTLQDGRIVTGYYFDENEDGTAEVLGIDYTGDGKPDEMTPLQ